MQYLCCLSVCEYMYIYAECVHSQRTYEYDLFVRGGGGEGEGRLKCSRATPERENEILLILYILTSTQCRGTVLALSYLVCLLIATQKPVSFGLRVYL